jgi:hypothetical protein
VTDGVGGIKRLSWPGGGAWQELAEGNLGERIASAPVVLPAGPDGGRPVCVAGASGTVMLLAPDLKTVLRRWPPRGKITAGPFVRGGKIGCILDRRRLVWLDPGRQEPVWTYPGSADIVGEPGMMGPLLVVATEAGLLIGLDPATGNAAGEGYPLKANAAPATAPVPWGTEELFVPLTDGTVVLVPVSRLRTAGPPMDEAGAFGGDWRGGGPPGRRAARQDPAGLLREGSGVK